MIKNLSKDISKKIASQINNEFEDTVTKYIVEDMKR
jgi:hypothetical protein